MAYEHLNRAGVVWLIAKIKSALSDKVDKVTGKGLSTNDLTNTLKTSYDTAVTDVSNLKKVGAEKNTIVSVKVNGTAQTPDSSRAINLTIPTSDDIQTAVANKVDKVTGKGLSTNDLTNALKTSYDTAVTDVSNLKKVGAEKNTIVSVKVNGTAQTPDSNRSINITVPTNSDIQTAINDALSGITGIDIQVVTSLPTTGMKGVIYLVAHTHSDTGDAYDEYVWVASEKKYEKIGNTDVDLSGYIKTSDIIDITDADVSSLWNS